jgi:hypothetical protein
VAVVVVMLKFILSGDSSTVNRKNQVGPLSSGTLAGPSLFTEGSMRESSHLESLSKREESAHFDALRFMMLKLADGSKNN